jgi:mRNA deadenylase 3'-5' endonuclease subunit Ccr4
VNQIKTEKMNEEYNNSTTFTQENLNKNSLKQYLHPVSILNKKECPSGSDCKKTSIDSHKEEFFHSCQYGQRCRNYKDEIHLNRFTHPCQDKYCKNQEELHLKQFTHLKKRIHSCTPLEWEFIKPTQENPLKGNEIEINLQVCSFNLLAQQFISPKRYKYVDPNDLKWEHRKENLLKTIQSIDADVFCLQEVDVQTHDLFFILKQSFEIFISSNNTLAILKKKKCIWDIKSVSECSYESDHKRLYQKIQMISKMNGKTISIFNTHLIGDPSKKHIQTESSIELMTVVKEENGSSIVCGDFNATKLDDAYSTFSKGMIDSQKILFQTISKEEPPFTFKTDSICKTCDYIWFDASLELNGGIHHFYETIHSHIPNKQHSSDHLPICASFHFKKTFKIEFSMNRTLDISQFKSGFYPLIDYEPSENKVNLSNFETVEPIEMEPPRISKYETFWHFIERIFQFFEFESWFG